MEENNKIPPKQTAENIPKVGSKEISTSTEKIISSEENILPEKVIIETTNTENQNDMEVHHHAHNPAEPHHKKNWKAYFWEFLMLFLAVFCGFLAEYQLEHKIENDRGKQYTYSFYEDLITDSSHFNSLYNYYDKKLSVLKTMSPCYDSLLSNNSSKNCLSIIMGNSLSFLDMIYTDRTISQLKNAGGLRLLKKEDADKILSYDNLLRTYKIYESTGLQSVQYELRETAVSLRDYKQWKDTANKPQVVSVYADNKELLNKYFNQLSLYTQYCNVRLNQLKSIIKTNAELIEYFKNKYHYE
jgi:hypothetical protein